ncbi:hypothetical protein [Rickettsiella grylli]|uniref:hypothetical protein n=1 Tax=Rickettsiella grylli TaxID=59196 RepID=UPI001F11BB82|nr:hypothetical protein [Rickettsiella grylli]
MIMKKSGLVIAATAAAIFLSGCATGARNIPENTPLCEASCPPPCVTPCNTCKCMSQCKQVCPPKYKKHRHRRCRTAENATNQMNG